MKVCNYYPFGLKHKGYNNTVSSGNPALKHKTYQGQEFTDELGLNIHEWKYRISDPALGRFYQIDPLAQDYTYNSTYAFQENKLGLGVELEGLELKRLRGGVQEFFRGVNRFLGESVNVGREIELSGVRGQEVAKNAAEARRKELITGVGEINSGAEDAVKGGIHLTGEVLDEAGDKLEIGAIVAAPFTEGASLSLTIPATIMQTSGKALKTGVKISDGDRAGAAKEVANGVVDIALGKAASKAIKQSKKVGNITTVKQEKTQDAALQAVNKMISKAMGIFTNDISDQNVIK